MHVWGYPTKVRLQNPFERKKMDHKIVNGCFIGYSKGFKEYRFYYPKQSSRIVKIGNTKFIKLDNISVNTKLSEGIFEKAQVDVPIPITS